VILTSKLVIFDSESKFFYFFCTFFMSVVLTDMTAVNDRKKHVRSKDGDVESHNAVSYKADNAFCRSEKYGMPSNLATFRIPRKQKHEDGKDDLRCERKTVNFGPDILLKTDTQKRANGTANTSVARAGDIGSRDLFIRNCVKRDWSVPAVRASKRNTFRSTSSGNTSLNTDSHPSSKLSVGVPSRSAMSYSDLRQNADVRTNKQQSETRAVVSDGKLSTSSGNTSLNTDSHPCSKFSVGVPSRSAASYSDLRQNADARTNKQQPETRAGVSDGKHTFAQAEPQEVTPKLPEELIRAGWKLCWSKQRSRWYVFNVRTGSSSWDVPK